MRMGKPEQRRAQHTPGWQAQADWHWPLLAMVLSYTAIHAIFGGYYMPMKILTGDQLQQIKEEIAPLQRFLADGTPITLENPRQYGPVFLFLMLPMLAAELPFPVLEHALYAIAIICVLAAFGITCRTLFPDGCQWRARCFMLILWFNFSALYHLLGTKNVETWELLLIAMTLYAVQNGKSWISGASVAAAALIKLLPLFFFLYLFLRDRRAFWHGCVVLVGILAVSHAVFGPAMGAWYLPGVVANGIGQDSFAATYFENNALKGVVYRLFSGFARSAAHPYTFVLSPSAARAAFLMATVLQLALLGIVVLLLWKRRKGDALFAEFGLVSAAMLLISPLAIWEYATLLLVAFSCGLYLLLAKQSTTVQKFLFIGSYLLLGHFIPFHILLQHPPLNSLDALPLAPLSTNERYKAVGLPFLGYAMLFAFFATMCWERRKSAFAKSAPAES